MGLRLGARVGPAAALAALIFLSLPPTLASATFPGANGKIFYTSDASGYLDIWSMEPSGANKTDLTKTEVWDERSAASPNGQTVAYSSHVNHNDVGIYLMNADGSNGRTLIDDPEMIEWDPAFTPDGASLLFSGQSMTNNGDVYTVPVAGGTPVDLTNNEAIDRDPEACASNGRIVFVSSRTGDNDIYVMDANGSNQTDLTKVSGSQEIQPSWSPDCAHIVYVSNQNAGKYEVYVMEASGANQTRITSTTAEEQNPTWSPDGKLIAYASGSYVVIQAPTPGAPTTPINVGPVGAEAAQPTWAPVPGSTPGGGGAGGGGGSTGGPSSSGIPPATKIAGVHVHGKTAIVVFSGSASGLNFKCKLDKGKFRPCTSPKKYKHLKAGKHTVQVEAIDPSGLTDLTPAHKKFKIR